MKRVLTLWLAAVLICPAIGFTAAPVAQKKSSTKKATDKKDSSKKNATGKRTGAKCKDGTTSTATGSGACSHHGGVKEWITEKP